MPVYSHKLGMGIGRREDLVTPVAQSNGAPSSSLGIDLVAHSDSDVSAFNLPRGNEALNQILETVLAKANAELANLLQDVRTKSAAGLLGTAQDGCTKKLLMRAVQCALKQSMLQAELGSLALRDEL